MEWGSIVVINCCNQAISLKTIRQLSKVQFSQVASTRVHPRGTPVSARPDSAAVGSPMGSAAKRRLLAVTGLAYSKNDAAYSACCQLAADENLS